MDTFTLNCLVQGNDKTFSVEIDRNKDINQLKKAILKEVIKEKKRTEFYNIDSDKLKIWKTQIHEGSDELNNLILCDNDQLREGTRKISSYFTDKPLYNYIHIIVKPPLPPLRFDLVCKLGLLSEGDTVEYLDKNCIHKATLFEGHLCTKDGRYHSFTEFIRVARKTKPKEKLCTNDFYNLKINGMTYWEIRNKLYKLYFYCKQDEDKNEGNLFIILSFNQNKHCIIFKSNFLRKR